MNEEFCNKQLKIIEQLGLKPSDFTNSIGNAVLMLLDKSVLLIDNKGFIRLYPNKTLSKMINIDEAKRLTYKFKRLKNFV